MVRHLLINDMSLVRYWFAQGILKGTFAISTGPNDYLLMISGIEIFQIFEA
jgi:hypothetical protein